MDGVEQVQKRRVIGFQMAERVQRRADYEDVGALGKGVAARGADYGFAEFAHGEEDGG